MSQPSKPLTALRFLNLATLVLLLATVVVSAYLRMSLAGVGCEPWPGCYGQASLTSASEAAASPSGAVLAARVLHRVVASLALLCMVASCLVAWSARTTPAQVRALVSGLLLAGLALAALGVATPRALAPLVPMGNLLGGLATLALAWRLQGCLRQPDGAWSWPSRGPLGTLATLALVAQLASGAWLSTSLAGASCASLVECHGLASEQGWPWAATDPSVAPAFAAGAAHVHLGGAPLQWLHRTLSGFAALALLAWAANCWRQGRRRFGGALAALTLTQLLLGMALSPLTLVVALAHNLGAAALLALAAGGLPATATSGVLRDPRTATSA